MRYVEFGKTGKQLSCLGFGAMRLPVMSTEQDKASENIDMRAALDLLQYAYDHGVNYVDTAYIYHDGRSEVVVGQSLKNGYRDKVYLADKMPTWLVKKSSDLDKLFAEQLRRLDTQHIDFYLLHALNAKEWTRIQAFDVLNWCAEKQRQGWIRHIGFSFHDGYAAFTKIVDDYAWDFCQIQYNYVNERIQAGTKGVEYAAAKGLPLVIMEPLLGGKLATTKALGKSFTALGRTPVDMALQWLWDKPPIRVVLSGMNAMQQLQDNIKYASASGPGSLGAPEHAAIADAQEIMLAMNAVACTACRYCIHCPQHIDIPQVFSLYNSARNTVLGKCLGEARDAYNELDVLADKCIVCCKCEQHCPQQISIVDNLKAAHELLYRAPKTGKK